MKMAKILKVGESLPRGVRGVDYTKHAGKNGQVQLHVNFLKNVRTLPKSHMHILNVSIRSAKFEECHLKYVRGVDYTNV
jgi:hypothetical protein